MRSPFTPDTYHSIYGDHTKDPRRFVCIFADGENLGSHQFLNWWQQYATGILRFNYSNLPGEDHTKKRATQMGGSLFGGPEEIRTPDPYNANVMRSQLRYGPVCFVLYAVWGGLSRIKCDRETWRGLPQNARKMRKFFVSFFRNIRLKRCFAVWYNTKC